MSDTGNFLIWTIDTFPLPQAAWDLSDLNFQEKKKKIMLAYFRECSRAG